MFYDLKRVAACCMVMGLLLAASQKASFGAANGFTGFSRSLAIAPVKAPANMLYGASKKTWRNTNRAVGRLTPSFFPGPVKMPLSKGGKGISSRRLKKLLLVQKTGMADKYAYASVARMGFRHSILSSTGKKTKKIFPPNHIKKK